LVRTKEETSKMLG
jgi:hypothetical protein